MTGWIWGFRGTFLDSISQTHIGRLIAFLLRWAHQKSARGIWVTAHEHGCAPVVKWMLGRKSGGGFSIVRLSVFMHVCRRLHFRSLLVFLGEMQHFSAALVLSQHSYDTHPPVGREQSSEEPGQTTSFNYCNSLLALAPLLCHSAFTQVRDELILRGPQGNWVMMPAPKPWKWNPSNP